jgi:hypothetical protein
LKRAGPAALAERRPPELWQEQAGQDGDDGDHHQQIDEGEGPVPVSRAIHGGLRISWPEAAYSWHCG